MSEVQHMGELFKFDGESMELEDRIRSAIGIVDSDGDGDIENMDEILSYIKNQNYNGWVVVEAEQDSAVANPFEYAKMGYEFINKHMSI